MTTGAANCSKSGVVLKCLRLWRKIGGAGGARLQNSRGKRWSVGCAGHLNRQKSKTRARSNSSIVHIFIWAAALTGGGGGGGGAVSDNINGRRRVICENH